MKGKSEMRNKRKLSVYSIILLLLSLSFTFAGCSKVSSYQESIYSDESKIIKEADSYSYIIRTGSTKDNISTIGFKTFNGMETLWTINTEERGTLTIDYDTVIEQGKFKLVLINPNNEVQTILENEQSGTATIEMIKGKSRLKIVGLDARGEIEITLSMSNGVKAKSINHD